MELKITKEKVLEAASKCSTAKETLKTLFPEAFQCDRRIVYGKFGDNDGLRFSTGEYLLSESSSLKGAFHLSQRFKWELRVSGAETFLIPTSYY